MIYIIQHIHNYNKITPLVQFWKCIEILFKKQCNINFIKWKKLQTFFSSSVLHSYWKNTSYEMKWFGSWIRFNNLITDLRLMTMTKNTIDMLGKNTNSTHNVNKNLNMALLMRYYFRPADAHTGHTELLAILFRNIYICYLNNSRRRR